VYKNSTATADRTLTLLSDRVSTIVYVRNKYDL
jgi:hypothetical protein